MIFSKICHILLQNNKKEIQMELTNQETIGSIIKKYRKSKNLTLQDVADKLNTTNQAIHKYEKGLIKNIPEDKLKAIVSLLEISGSDYIKLYKLWTAENYKALLETDMPEEYKDIERLRAKLIQNFINSQYGGESYNPFVKTEKYFCIDQLFFSKDFMDKLNPYIQFLISQERTTETTDKTEE